MYGVPTLTYAAITNYWWPTLQPERTLSAGAGQAATG